MRVNFTHRYSDFSFHINNKCMSSFMIRFLSNDSWSFLDRFLWCHLKCIVWVFKSPFWEASMLGHGAGIGYTGPGWAPLTISVWWRGRISPRLHLTRNVITTVSKPGFQIKPCMASGLETDDASPYSPGRACDAEDYRSPRVSRAVVRGLIRF